MPTAGLTLKPCSDRFRQMKKANTVDVSRSFWLCLPRRESFRMFDEGRRRKQRGQDLVVGAVQSKLSPELSQILSSLEIVPALNVESKGKVYQVLDVDAILKRHPECAWWMSLHTIIRREAGTQSAGAT